MSYSYGYGGEKELLGDKVGDVGSGNCKRFCEEWDYNCFIKCVFKMEGRWDFGVIF